MTRITNQMCSILGTAALILVALPVQAQDSDFAGAFREMLPDVSYSADKLMTITMEGNDMEMKSKVVYAPYREWTSTTTPGMEAASVITVTDHMTGKLVSSVMGMNTTTQIDPAQELANGHDGASFKFIGETPLNGVNVKVYDFALTQESESETYNAKGRMFLDDNGIPRQALWTVETSEQGTVKMRVILENVQVGPQDESVFALLDAPSSGGNGSMASLMSAAMGQSSYAAQAGPAPSYDPQSKSIRGSITGWPGGSGRVIDDNGVVIGMVSAEGQVSITATGEPGGEIYPMGGGFYDCDGTNLSDAAARYQVREGLAVIDTSSTPVGRLIFASSYDVASWWANPVNNAATPGYTVSLVYVDRPVQSTGFCVSGNQTEDRRLDFEPGWNIEKETIEAVGDSATRETDQPTQIVRETVDEMPADTVWIFENFSPDQQQAARQNPNLPDPIQEIVDEATEVATDAAKDEVNDQVRKGIGRLFRR